MNCILYLTDFSEPSRHTLDYLLPVADELRARILFVYFIPAQGAPVQKVNKSEESEYLQALNQLKQVVVRFGFTNNCEMLTGHRIVKGDLIQNIKKLLKDFSPYALIPTPSQTGIFPFDHTFIRDVLNHISRCPLLLIPPSAQFVSIKTIAFFSAVYENSQREIIDLLFKVRLFKSKLIACFTNYSGSEPELIAEQIQNLFPDAVRQDRFSLESIDDPYVLVQVQEILRQFSVDLAAFHAGDKIYEAIFSEHSAFNEKVAQIPLLIYPNTFNPLLN